MSAMGYLPWMSVTMHIAHYCEAGISRCRWLARTFGYVVRQHWQLDTFGHSGVTAALSALGGMDSVFFSRLDKEVG